MAPFASSVLWNVGFAEVAVLQMVLVLLVFVAVRLAKEPCHAAAPGAVSATPKAR
jgi:hypothetical protein